MAQQAHVRGKFAGALGNPRQSRNHIVVHLPGVGLSANGHNACKAHFLGNLLLQLLDLLVVSLEQLQEGGLSTGGTLGAQQLQCGDAVLHLLQIHKKIVHPKGSPLADGDQLGRLEMGEAQSGHSLILVGKGGQMGNHLHQLGPNQLQTFPHQNHIRVVAHVAAGGAQVNDGHRLGAELAVGVNMRHHVMAQLLLPLGRPLIVNIGDMSLQLIHLLLGNRKPQFHFRPGQRDPKTTPSGELFICGKDIQHLIAGVAGGQGALIRIGCHIVLTSSSLYLSEVLGI